MTASTRRFVLAPPSVPGGDTGEKGKKGIILGVNEHSTVFLQYLDTQKLGIGVQVEVVDHIPYDNSLTIKVGKDRSMTVSHQVARNLFVSIN